MPDQFDPNFPEYLQNPQKINNGKLFGMKNLNDIKQDKWEYRESQYYNPDAIEKRANDFAKAVEASLKSAGVYQDPQIWLENKIKKTQEEAEMLEDLKKEGEIRKAEYLAGKRIYDAGDGSRWEDL